MSGPSPTPFRRAALERHAGPRERDYPMLRPVRGNGWLVLGLLALAAAILLLGAPGGR